MQLRDVVRPLIAVGKQVGERVGGLARLFVLEQVLAGALIVSPGVMVLFDWLTLDQFGIRDSISAYYAMEAAPAFYMPLTIAAMLFVTSGVVKDGRSYHVVLGLALSLVVVFNKDGFGWWHYLPAIGFYAGNAIVIAVTRARWRLKGTLLGLGLIVTVGFLVLKYGLDAPTALFWAEWAGMALIAVHFIFDSARGVQYQAP